VEWSFDRSLQEHIQFWESLLFQPCDILRHPQGAMTCETACPFTGCGAHSAVMGDEALAHFYLLIPQTQQVPHLR
jgi:hypothetical protein